MALRQQLGRPRHPVQIVATLRGLELDRGFFFNVPNVPVILLTTSSCAAQMRAPLARRPWVTVLRANRAEDLPDAFDELRQRGIDRVSCIGGRTLATQLLDMKLADDVYLTTSPQPGGKPDTPMYPRPLKGVCFVKKHGTGMESGVVFEHIHLGRDRAR